MVIPCCVCLEWYEGTPNRHEELLNLFIVVLCGQTLYWILAKLKENTARTLIFNRNLILEFKEKKNFIFWFLLISMANYEPTTKLNPLSLYN